MHLIVWMGSEIQAKMAHASLFGLIVLLVPCQAVLMCTNTLYKDKFLPDNQILKLTMPGILSCSWACLVRYKCMSFNFHTKTHECQLNSKSKDQVLTQLTKHEHFVFSDISHCIRVTWCLHRPANLENGHIKETPIPVENNLATVLPYNCDPGYMPQGDLVCLDNGTWSSPVCVCVSSCTMVKQYQPDSEDGEYWMCLTNFNYTTKIYCHDMSTSSPQEFLTLPTTNHGIYPKIQDYLCGGTTSPLTKSCKDEGGQIWFTKIKIDISTMEVAIHDTTFAKVSGNKYRLGYGIAYDCYTHHAANDVRCGTKGKFGIDLRGTGWRVSEDQQWEIVKNDAAWHTMIESTDRKMNGAVISLRCGGFPGGCTPKGGLFLTPNEADITAR